jgi:hypothetical protein
MRIEVGPKGGVGATAGAIGLLEEHLPAEVVGVGGRLKLAEVDLQGALPLWLAGVPWETLRRAIRWDPDSRPLSTPAQRNGRKGGALNRQGGKLERGVEVSGGV